MKYLLTERARALRQNSTHAENQLWYFLKDRRLHGYKFKRQYIIEPYIIDFICCKKKIVIELDGGHHAEAEAISYDQARTQFLNEKGYRVLRFWNDEVFKNIYGVLDMILSSLRPSPALRAPSPAKR